MKIKEYYSLKQELESKEKDLQTAESEYNSIISQEPYMAGRLKGRQRRMHILRGEINNLRKRIHSMMNKDTAEILRLSGFTVDACGAKDDDATEGGAIEQYGKDGGPGSGIKGHTTPKEPSYTSRSGYKLEEPKVIEEAIKKIKASGHADPHYLSGLEQALQLSKKERGIKDECGEKVYTKGTEDEDPDEKYNQFMKGKKKPLNHAEGKKLLEEAKKAGIHPDYLKGIEKGLASFKGASKDDEEQWITMKGTHVKIEEGQSKEKAAKEFIAEKGGNPAHEGGNSKSTTPSTTPSKETPEPSVKSAKGKSKSKWDEDKVDDDLLRDIFGEDAEYTDITEPTSIEEAKEFYKDYSPDELEDAIDSYREMKAELRDNWQDSDIEYKPDETLYDTQEDYEIDYNTHLKGKAIYKAVMADYNNTLKALKELRENSTQTKDSDPKVAEAESVINLCGGVK